MTQRGETGVRTRNGGETKKFTNKFEKGGGGDGDKFNKKRKFGDGIKEEKGAGKKKPRAYENIISGDGKPDWKKARMEMKQLKETRKKKEMKPEIYELSKEAKKIWEELRKENCPQNVRDKLCDQMHRLVKGHIKRLSFAHDTSRVLESLLMYGSEEVRASIHVAFASKDDIMLLMKSTYGHFLALKLMKYATKEQRDAIFKAIEAHVVTLLKHQFASRVLNDFYLTYAKATQKTIIIKECYAPLLRLESLDESLGYDLKLILEKFPEKKVGILNNLQELITFMLEKNMKTNAILHLLMHEYLENCAHAERTELITTMREELVNILHTNEGSLLGLSCLWHGTPKDRKVIVKSFKGFIPKIACDKNGYRVLLGVIDTVDDVVLVSKAICNEMLNNLNDLVLNQYGQRTVVYLLEHRSSLFFDPEISKLLAQGDSNEYTKKPIDQRLKDITEPLEQEFVDGVVDNFGMWMKENCPCLVAKFILKRFTGGHLNEAVQKVAECIAEASTTEGVERNPIEALSKLILMELPMETRLAFASELLVHLNKLGQVKPWLQTNRGCFVLLRIWEKCGQDSQPGKEVKKCVSSNIQILKKHKTAGGKLLSNIVEN